MEFILSMPIASGASCLIYKQVGIEGRLAAAMLFCLKSLASALLLSTAVLGAAVQGCTRDLHKRAQPKGIDVSSYQGNVNWNAVVANGVSFAYIKATEGTGERGGHSAGRRVEH